VWYWAADAFHYVVVPVAVLFFLRRAAGMSPGDYGFRRFGRDVAGWETTGLFLLVLGAYWAAWDPVKQIALAHLAKYASAFRPAMHEGLAPRLMVVTYLSLTAAMVEEGVFRGLAWEYFQALGRSWAVPAYVVTTAVLFGAIHSEQGPHGVIAAFSLGLVSAFLYSRIRNLWPFVTAHFLIDMGALWPH